ncbi:MAG: hypothetical protein ACE5OZ_26465 [Candidatus Heimdallarchaeota archaeon]
MLTVTATARDKLKEALQLKKPEAEVTFRILVTDSTPRRFEMGLDKEREGDQVVESKEGIKLLLIGPNLAGELEGLVFDYQETPKGAGFTITEASAGR